MNSTQISSPKETPTIDAPSFEQRIFVQCPLVALKLSELLMNLPDYSPCRNKTFLAAKEFGFDTLVLSFQKTKGTEKYQEKHQFMDGVIDFIKFITLHPSLQFTQLEVHEVKRSLIIIFHIQNIVSIGGEIQIQVSQIISQ